MQIFAVTDNRVTIDGTSVRYLDAGVGPPLLLLHGLGQSSTTWRRTFDALAERHRVIAPDLPGFGASDIPANAPYDPRYFAGLARRLMVELGLDRIDAVGHSAGALALALAALDHPHAFRRIVLVDPVGFTPVPGSLLGAAAASLMRLLVAVPRTRAMTRALYATAFFDPRETDEDTVDELVRRHGDKRARWASRRAFLRHFDFCKRLDPFHRRLADLKTPSMVVWGNDDRLFRSADASVAMRLLPGARLEVIDRCGHCPQIERPERFAALVLDFFAAQ